MTDWLDALSTLHQACRDTFGIPVVYLPSLRNHPELEGVPIPITAIFDDQLETLSIMGAGERGLEALVHRTTLELRLADLVCAPMAGDEVVVAGVSFVIREIDLEHQGAALLLLDRLSF